MHKEFHERLQKQLELPDEIAEDIIFEDESTQAYESVPEPHDRSKDINNDSFFRSTVDLVSESPILKPSRAKSSEISKVVDYPEILCQKEIEYLINQNVNQISESDKMALLEKFGHDQDMYLCQEG